MLAEGIATADQISGGRAYATWEVGQAVCDALEHHATGGAEFAANTLTLRWLPMDSATPG